MSKKAFEKIAAGLNDAIAISRGEVKSVSWSGEMKAALYNGRQIVSDADLRFALRIVSQLRRIEELKRICGIK